MSTRERERNIAFFEEIEKQCCKVYS